MFNVCLVNFGTNHPFPSEEKAKEFVLKTNFEAVISENGYCIYWYSPISGFHKKDPCRQIDSLTVTFVVSIRTTGSVGVHSIKDQLQKRYEVVDIKEVDTKITYVPGPNV